MDSHSSGRDKQSINKEVEYWACHLGSRAEEKHNARKRLEEIRRVAFYVKWSGKVYWEDHLKQTPVWGVRKTSQVGGTTSASPEVEGCLEVWRKARRSVWLEQSLREQAGRRWGQRGDRAQETTVKIVAFTGRVIPWDGWD